MLTVLTAPWIYTVSQIACHPLVVHFLKHSVDVQMQLLSRVCLQSFVITEHLFVWLSICILMTNAYNTCPLEFCN